MTRDWIIYDPDSDKFVDIYLNNYGPPVGVNTYEVDWSDDPVYYPFYGLFEILTNLSLGQLRAICDAQVIPKGETMQHYAESGLLLDWFENELKARGIQVEEDYFKRLGYWNG